MSSRFIRWTYLFVVIVVAVFCGYVLSSLQNADRVSCQNLRVIAENQRIGLNLAARYLPLSIAEQVELTDALAKLNESPPCKP